jgi:hypothetical protein
MTYWNRKTEDAELICDDCGEQRWETHPKYGTNVDSRLAERDATGAEWCWDTVYSQVTKYPCQVCKVLTY